MDEVGDSEEGCEEKEGFFYVSIGLLVMLEGLEFG